ncbi:transmembrane emp24 domain-containing protein 5-like [Galleria mellonella]|uniref:Transmembrane emp24 domain-containing protein 5-like n=1 Tax=Galleria mellonella TaxID=7137 RepID=A0A6J1X3P0_GALME|nr:transmembrane emp24 domain-containing protein 5-like [Galleria mellonella]
MHYASFYTFAIILCVQCAAQSIYETDVNFRVDPGSRTCFFEEGKAGQTLEVYYQVLDGQHGDLDIIFEIINPQGVQLVADYKKSQNSIIMDLEMDGDYVFCMDNTISVINSKLVFVYVMIENKVTDDNDETEVSVVDADGERKEEEEVIEWTGTDEEGNAYYIEVKHIHESLSRTLKQVVKARHLLDLYGAMKSRDSYLAFEDTFIVDVWSIFQIFFMITVGLLQVYMIKKLFNRSNNSINDYY